MPGCGLDFGTSNSALGIVRDGVPVLAPMEGDEHAHSLGHLLRFREPRPRRIRARSDRRLYRPAGRPPHAGAQVDTGLLADGREDERVGRRRIALTEVVELFIRHLKQQAETFAAHDIDQVVHGRPVRFVDGDDAADARAQAVLEGIAHRAGFRDVSFVYEPIAAAYHYEETVAGEELVLVADVGGGTSDFTVIRIAPGLRTKPDRRDDILANGGIRIGGTDFDRFLSIASVMPLLGMGTQLITKDLPMPGATYFELATWATINFAYTIKTERETGELVVDSREPDKTRRLLKTLRRRLGHRIAFGVEDAKIALSEEEHVDIPLDFLEAGLVASASQRSFEHAIGEKSHKLSEVALACVRDAGVTPEQIHTVFLTGGSSRVPAVRAAISAAAPSARMTTGSDFLSVALGLTREAQRRYG